MNPFEMVVAIMAVIMIASVLKARIKARHGGFGDRLPPQPDPEAQRLRDEVRQLKARVAVLERLATDSSSALDREFETLRNQD
jgi:citrate synthase